MTIRLEDLLHEASGEVFGAMEAVTSCYDQVRGIKDGEFAGEEVCLGPEDASLQRELRLLADELERGTIAPERQRQLATFIEFMAQAHDEALGALQEIVQWAEERHNATVPDDDGVSPALKEMRKNPASWVVKSKYTGAVVCELWDKDMVAKLNDHYVAVPIIDHLHSLNAPAAPVVRKRRRPGT